MTRALLLPVLLLVAQPTWAAPAPKAQKQPQAQPSGLPSQQRIELRPVSASTKYPKGTRVGGKLKNKPVQAFTAQPAKPAEPTSLSLSPAGPGKMTLKFVSRDPSWTMDPKGGVAIQLNTATGFELTPSVITRSEWPANASQITVAYRIQGKPSTRITVKAAYGICNRKTGKCQKALTRLIQPFKQ